MSKQRKKAYIAMLILAIAGFVLLQVLMNFRIINRYWQSIINLICINIILAVSLNIVVGNLGQINLGHAGFMAIGAYTAAIFMKARLVPGVAGFLISLVLAGLVSCLVGILIGLPVLRLHGDYLAIVTLAFGEIVRVLVENLKITGGAQGLAGIPVINNFALIYVLTIVSVALMYSVMTSRHGRAVLAIKDNELAAQSSGINVTYYKTFAFGLSALFAGVAGAIYAQTIGVIGSNVFNYNKSFDILVMVVLGGMGSFTGSIISATGLTILPEVLRSLSDWRMIIYSVVLVLVMIFRPEGLMGRREFSIRKFLKIDNPKTGEGKAENINKKTIEEVDNETREQ
ncbi:MAG: branched-chain amino acid ABC transporter permease [Finegoldia sp.]|nr:branched-chain amino acid ABC transporter permease [Finegoldia sp.]